MTSPWWVETIPFVAFTAWNFWLVWGHFRGIDRKRQAIFFLAWMVGGLLIIVIPGPHRGISMLH